MKSFSDGLEKIFSEGSFDYLIGILVANAISAVTLSVMSDILIDGLIEPLLFNNIEDRTIFNIEVLHMKLGMFIKSFIIFLILVLISSLLYMLMG